MGLRVRCQCGRALCIALIPAKGRASGAPLQLHPRLGQSLCAGDGDEHSVPAPPCRSTVRPAGHKRLPSAPVCRGRGPSFASLLSSLAPCVCVWVTQFFQIMLKLRGSTMMRPNHEFLCSVALSPGFRNWVEMRESVCERERERGRKGVRELPVHLNLLVVVWVRMHMRLSKMQFLVVVCMSCLSCQTGSAFRLAGVHLHVHARTHMRKQHAACAWHRQAPFGMDPHTQATGTRKEVECRRKKAS